MTVVRERYPVSASSSSIGNVWAISECTKERTGSHSALKWSVTIFLGISSIMAL